MKRGIAAALATFCVSGVLAEDAKPWDVSASVGVSMTSGNTDTMSVNPEIRASGASGKNEIKLRALYNYGEKDDVISERNAKGTAQYNRLLGERAYAYGNGEVGFDDPANINYRAIAGPGAGYYFVKSDRMNLSAEAGASLIAEETEADLAGGGADTENSEEIALRVAQKFDMKIGAGAKVFESVEYLPQADDFDIYLLNAEVGLEAAVNGGLSMRMTLANAHDSEPAPGKEKDDTTFKAALVYVFGRK